MNVLQSHLLIMPFVLVAMGGAAVYLHGRYIEASRRAEAKAHRAEG